MRSRTAGGGQVEQTLGPYIGGERGARETGDGRRARVRACARVWDQRVAETEKAERDGGGMFSCHLPHAGAPVPGNICN